MRLNELNQTAASVSIPVYSELDALGCYVLREVDSDGRHPETWCLPCLYESSPGRLSPWRPAWTSVDGTMGEAQSASSTAGLSVGLKSKPRECWEQCANPHGSSRTMGPVWSLL